MYKPSFANKCHLLSVDIAMCKGCLKTRASLSICASSPIFPGSKAGNKYLLSLEFPRRERVPIVPQLLHVHEILRNQRRIFGGVRRQIHAESCWSRGRGAMRLIRRF